MPYQAIFANQPHHGTPDAPTPTGFLRLAVAGPEVWNAWRAAYPTEWDGQSNVWRRAVNWQAPNTEHVTLDHHPGLDFSGFNFGDGARFANQTLSRRSGHFAKAIFGNETVFESVVFRGGAIFSGAQFGNNCRLSHIAFRSEGNDPMPAFGWVNFEDTVFGDDAQLALAIQWNRGDAEWQEIGFRNSRFGHRARIHFIAPRLADDVRFDGARFGAGGRFSSTSPFNFPIVFRGCVFEASTSFSDFPFAEADFSNCAFGPDVNFRGKDFSDISFAHTRFVGGVDFSNRKFQARTNFAGVRFGKAPLFHNCDLHQDTHFDEESFPARPEGSADASRAYRTLKLAMSQHQATREEQLFFRLEMREERAVMWKSQGLRGKVGALLYGLYDVLSGYGQSVWRPFAGLLFLLLTFAGLYAMSSPTANLWVPGITSFNGTETLRWLTYSLASSVPLGGLDDASRELRRVLGITVGPWHAAALVVQKVLSLLLVFLIGLALRNLFKMK